MAGAGYKLFNTGDVLTAQQVNEYLMQQTVMVFANASARTTALSGVLAEGMLSYLQDTNATEVYNGSAWVALAADQTPLTTKGDLFTYTTTDARLASSNVNGDVLTVDTSTASGLKWATPSSGSTPNLTAEDATYYIKPSKYAVVTASTLNLDAGVLFYIPIFLPANTYDRIGLYTHSTHTGTSVFRLGLYSVNATTGKPSAVVFDAGTVSATAASTVYEITISQNLSAGYYYLALNLVSKTGNAFLGYLGSGAQNTASSLFNSTLGAQTNTNTSLYENGVTGALPSPTPAGYTNEVFHTVGMRMS